MTATLITAYLGQGLAAARPATPLVATGTFAYWYSTDTGLLSAYLNGAWSDVIAESLIQTQTPSGVGTVTFSSIPTGFKHLKLVFTARGTQAATTTNLQMTFNGDSGNNYDYQQENRFGLGTANGVAFIAPAAIAGANATANYATDGIINIFNYSGSTFYKGINCYEEILDAQNAAGMLQQTTGGWWRNTAPITSLTLALASGNYVAGTTLSLYGVPG